MTNLEKKREAFNDVWTVFVKLSVGYISHNEVVCFVKRSFYVCIFKYFFHSNHLCDKLISPKRSYYKLSICNSSPFTVSYILAHCPASTQTLKVNHQVNCYINHKLTPVCVFSFLFLTLLSYPYQTNP